MHSFLKIIFIRPLIVQVHPNHFGLQPKVATEGKEVVLHVAGRVAERVEDALPFVSVRFDGRDERAQPFRYFIRHGGDFSGWYRRRKRQHVPAVLS